MLQERRLAELGGAIKRKTRHHSAAASCSSSSRKIHPTRRRRERRKTTTTTTAAAASTTASDFILSEVATILRTDGKSSLDYYDLLGVPLDAGPKAIKAAYRRRAKACHPDIAGDEGHEVCIVLNEAYETLMDEDQRAIYDTERPASRGGGEIIDVDNPFAETLRDVPYTGEPLSDWCDPTQDGCCIETDDQLTKGVFVDEITCIGCKMCLWCAENTFECNEEHGRARVKAQWRDSEVSRRTHRAHIAHTHARTHARARTSLSSLPPHSSSFLLFPFPISILCFGSH